MNYDVTPVIVPSSDNQIRMIRGVMEYAQSVDGFRIAKNAAIPYVPWSMLERTKSDGVVAYAETEQQAALLAGLNVPTVNLTLHQRPSPKVSAVHSDNGLIGSWAADHLLSLGLRHFAFVGHLKWYHNELRCNGFDERLNKAGFSVTKIDLRFESETEGDVSVRLIDQKQLKEAIASLETPVGILAAHDEFAFEVVEATKAVGRSVPFDVAVIGVNNYRLICETTSPALSSIAQNSERIGYLGAELLHGLMQGQEPPSVPIVSAPSKIVVRRSSEYLAIDDEELIPVVKYVREKCHHPINATDIAVHFDLSRKSLDKRFIAALGHTVSKELRAERIRLAQRLLTTTNMRILDVGIKSGFDSASGFVRAFRESTGMTPGQVRGGNTN